VWWLTAAEHLPLKISSSQVEKRRLQMDGPLVESSLEGRNPSADILINRRASGEEAGVDTPFNR